MNQQRVGETLEPLDRVFDHSQRPHRVFAGAPSPFIFYSQKEYSQREYRSLHNDVVSTAVTEAEAMPIDWYGPQLGTWLVPSGSILSREYGLHGEDVMDVFRSNNVLNDGMTTDMYMAEVSSWKKLIAKMMVRMPMIPYLPWLTPAEIDTMIGGASFPVYGKFLHGSTEGIKIVRLWGDPTGSLRHYIRFFLHGSPEMRAAGYRPTAGPIGEAYPPLARDEPLPVEMYPLAVARFNPCPYMWNWWPQEQPVADRSGWWTG